MRSASIACNSNTISNISSVSARAVKFIQKEKQLQLAKKFNPPSQQQKDETNENDKQPTALKFFEGVGFSFAIKIMDQG